MIALPAIVANVAWQWMMERGRALWETPWLQPTAAGFEPGHTPWRFPSMLVPRPGETTALSPKRLYGSEHPHPHRGDLRSVISTLSKYHQLSRRFI
jgi:hypothetical protein